VVTVKSNAHIWREMIMVNHVMRVNFVDGGYNEKTWL